MDKAKIIKVSCCGANELLDINETVKFIKENPNVEVGIGVSREKCSFDMPRFKWILTLQEKLKDTNCSSQIAFHVNGSWSKEIVEQGFLPNELDYLIRNNEAPIRIQLNVIGSGYDLNVFSSVPLAYLTLSLYKENLARFILPANKDSFSFIKRLENELKNYCNEFDLLYDSSFGMGKKADHYVSYFPKHLQGYAGGLCGENVQDEIIKINAIQDTPVYIWVDAENKIRNDNINTLDLTKAQKFVDKAFEMNHIKTLENPLTD